MREKRKLFFEWRFHKRKKRGGDLGCVMVRGGGSMTAFTRKRHRPEELPGLLDGSDFLEGGRWTWSAGSSTGNPRKEGRSVNLDSTGRRSSLPYLQVRSG